jgi:hypothetical protein
MQGGPALYGGSNKAFQCLATSHSTTGPGTHTCTGQGLLIQPNEAGRSGRQTEGAGPHCTSGCPSTPGATKGVDRKQTQEPRQVDRVCGDRLYPQLLCSTTHAATCFQLTFTAAPCCPGNTVTLQGLQAEPALCSHGHCALPIFFLSPQALQN